MARIAFCANTAWNISNFRTPILDALLARGDEIVVIAGRDESEAKLQNKGCEVIRVAIDAKSINPLQDLALVMRYRQLYARHRPDVILNFTIKAVLYSTLSARSIGIPVINTITGLGTAFIKDTWLSNVVQMLYRSILPGTQPIVFQNEEDLALFREHGFITKNFVSVVPGSGVDLVQFPNTTVSQADCITFLFIGRLLTDKGVCEFVEAARLVRKAYPYARFQILGPMAVANRTALSNESVSRWVEERTVEYLGSVEDVRPFIEQAHCIVLPSYREGMPRVLLEAAAMGRPLIATAVPGCRDVVRNGVNGYLCVPRDAADLAGKMHSLIQLSHRERQEMGRASRLLAEERFDVRRVVKTYLELIDNELAGTGKAGGSSRANENRTAGRAFFTIGSLK